MISCQNAEQLWEREEVESGAELGARDGSLMVRMKWLHEGSLTPSTSVKQCWQQHVLCMVVFGQVSCTLVVGG